MWPVSHYVFCFHYICVCFPVWGHLSLNSWKQAVYSRALSQNTGTPDPWHCWRSLLAVGIIPPLTLHSCMF